MSVKLVEAEALDGFKNADRSPTPDFIARMVVKHHGVDPENEIKLIALSSYAVRLTALKEAVIDAMIVAPPVDFEAK